jgi:hypothetical protein
MSSVTTLSDFVKHELGEAADWSQVAMIWMRRASRAATAHAVARRRRAATPGRCRGLCRAFLRWPEFTSMTGRFFLLIRILHPQPLPQAPSANARSFPASSAKGYKSGHTDLTTFLRPLSPVM